MNHRIIQFGSFKLAKFVEELTVPRLRSVGLFPYQLSGVITPKLTNEQIRKLKGSVKSLSELFPFMQGHINTIVGTIFLNKSSSFGGTVDMTRQVTNLLSLWNNYSHDELLLEPLNGLPYYMLNERIDFDAAREFVFERSDLKSAFNQDDFLSSNRIELPSYIMDKCSYILNEQCNAKMHTICFLSQSNSFEFDSHRDGCVQFMQIDDLSYVLIIYFENNKTVMVYQFKLLTNEQKEQLTLCLQLRYDNVSINFIHINNTVDLYVIDRSYSGIWCSVWAVNYFLDKGKLPCISIELNEVNERRLLDWFFDLVVHERLVVFN